MDISYFQLSVLSISLKLNIVELVREKTYRLNLWKFMNCDEC